LGRVIQDFDGQPRNGVAHSASPPVKAQSDILVAFGIADMHALTPGINITDLQAQALSETQAQTVKSVKEKTPESSVFQVVLKQLCGLFRRDNIGQVFLRPVV